MARNCKVELPGVKPFGIKLSISYSPILGCHSSTFSTPLVYIYSTPECKMYMTHESFKEFGLNNKKTDPKACGYWTFARSWNPELLESFRNCVYDNFEDLMLEIMTNNRTAIAVMSDHLEGEALINIRGLVKHLLSKKGWAGFASPIVNNPGHSTQNHNSFCQVWSLIPPDKLSYAIAETSWQAVPLGLKQTPESIVKCFVNDGQNAQRYVAETGYVYGESKLENFMEQFKYFNSVPGKEGYQITVYPDKEEVQVKDAAVQEVVNWV